MVKGNSGLRVYLIHLRYLTPADVYFGIEQEILEGRKRIKEQTVQRRQRQHQLETARA